MVEPKKSKAHLIRCPSYFVYLFILIPLLLILTKNFHEAKQNTILQLDSCPTSRVVLALNKTKYAQNRGITAKV
jgi:ABC-type sulfate transport system permease subunit